jgi:flagellar basal-body rod protein FlgB
MLENINLLNGLTDKMAYSNQRQRVLSQNISNADTPGYAPSDIKTPDFAKVLGVSAKGNAKQLSLETTQGNHIAHRQQIGDNKALAAQQQRRTYEISPAGNAVNLEEQMMLASRNNMDYQLVTNLYNKNLEILRSAMRKSN